MHLHEDVIRHLRIPIRLVKNGQKVGHRLGQVIHVPQILENGRLRAERILVGLHTQGEHFEDTMARIVVSQNIRIGKRKIRAFAEQTKRQSHLVLRQAKRRLKRPGKDIAFQLKLKQSPKVEFQNIQHGVVR